MQIKIKCPNKDCGKTLVVESDMAGKKGKCSTCDTVFMIPAAPGSKSQPGGSTVDLEASKSGERSAERKKASKSASRRSSKRRPGSKSGATEKFLDDYVEEPKSKGSRGSGGVDDFALSENDYVDYDDYEDEPPRQSRSPRRRERPAGGRDDFYDDYEDDYDAPPRGGRRRRDNYYEDDPYEDPYYEEPYEEPYGAPAPGGGRSGRRRKSGPNLGLIRAGMMIMAIAGFVFIGAVAIKILIELIWMLSSRPGGDTSTTFWKIAELLWLGAAIAVIVGYSFLLFFPNKNNSMGLTIAALSVGSVNILVLLVFKVVPLFSDGSGFMGLGSFMFGSSSIVEPMLKVGFIEGLFIAEIILIALALMAINKQLKDRYNMQSAKQMIIPAGIYGGILVVVGMFLLILSETRIESKTAFDIWKWVLYLLRVASQGMLIWYFISYSLLMFNTRNAMPKS